MVDPGRPDPDSPAPHRRRSDSRGPAVTVNVHPDADTEIWQERVRAGTAVVVFDGARLSSSMNLFLEPAELRRLRAVLDAALADLDTDPAARGDVGGVS